MYTQAKYDVSFHYIDEAAEKIALHAVTVPDPNCGRVENVLYTTHVPADRGVIVECVLPSCSVVAAGDIIKITRGYASTELDNKYVTTAFATVGWCCKNETEKEQVSWLCPSDDIAIELLRQKTNDGVNWYCKTVKVIVPACGHDRTVTVRLSSCKRVGDELDTFTTQ
jgi:hypothetical protein